jgi:hypothetical protein
LKENLFAKLDLLVKDGLSLVSNVSTITQEENDRTIGNVDRGVDLLAADANEATENIEKFYTIFEDSR